MKKCELCNSVARMYCDSDRAILCWDCDAKVHAANFLVAKHYRTLLCHICQSPTSWTGSGPKLGPTVSICETCFRSSNSKNNAYDDDDDEKGDNNDEEESNKEDDDDDDDSSNGGDCDEDDEDNQVVPLSFTPLAQPPVSSSSSSDESSGRLRSGRDGEPKSTIGFSYKRTWH